MRLPRVGPSCAVAALLLLTSASARGNEWLYYLGGSGTSGQLSDVHYIEVLPGGVLNGSWSSAPPLPVAGAEICATTVGGDIVVIYGGGCVTCWGPCYDNVYWATVDPNSGNFLTGWNSTAPVPAAAYQPRVAVDPSGNLYVVGPNAGQVWASSYTPGVGVSGGWTLQPSAPGAALEHNAAGDGLTYFLNIGASVYAAPIAGGSFGSWSTTTSLPVSTIAGAMVATQGYLYLFGGQTSSPSSDIYSAPIGGPGVGAWTIVGALPSAVLENECVVAGGYFFHLAGTNGACAASQNDVYSAPVVASGGIGGWTSQVPMPVFRHEGAAAVAYSVITPTPSQTRTRTMTRTPTGFYAATATPTGSPVGTPPAGPAPNPFTRSLFGPNDVVFHGVPALATVEIYNLRGERIQTLPPAQAGTAVWELDLLSRRRIASGLYVYLFRSANGVVLRTGRIAVQ